MPFQPIYLTFNLQASLQQLSASFGKTLLIFFLTIIFLCRWGLLLRFAECPNQALQLLTKLYISIMRGTPVTASACCCLFAPYYVFGIKLSNDYRFWAVI
jgi:ABC-type amino acid transport system permease subunit